MAFFCHIKKIEGAPIKQGDVERELLRLKLFYLSQCTPKINMDLGINKPSYMV